jgi:hypothetical protein
MKGALKIMNLMGLEPLNLKMARNFKVNIKKIKEKD